MNLGRSRRRTSTNRANPPDRLLPVRTAGPLGTKKSAAVTGGFIRMPSALFDLSQTNNIRIMIFDTSKGCDARAAPTNRGAAMKSVIIKRSIVLNGHKTSVSLENEFWEGLRQIAESQKSKVSALVQRIDRERTNRNLSSAIRIYV